MTHKLIYTPDYLLVVDNSEIKKSDFCYDLDGSPGYKNNKFIVQCLRTAIDSYWNKNCKKIIAHLPLNNSPILTDMDLLPPLEDEVEELAKSAFTHPDFGKYKVGSIAYYNGYKDGYNKAKEKYKYTEEDMIDFSIWRSITIFDQEKPLTVKGQFELWKSLSQPKMPVGFECEESVFFATNAFSSDITLTSEGLQDTVLKGIKTTTNSQGQTQWVGKYIY